MDRYIVYTNLLSRYANATDEEEMAKIRYELNLLKAGFNPTYGGANGQDSNN